ncbi:MAG TPA: hypothetical protein VKZ79_14740 [Alphaproteobacteria bacterium]|nr:hypothetical protein [Alphaproteobacteria bacterium]
MNERKSKPEDGWTCEAECFECGIKLSDGEIAEVDGETLCDQCAEEYMREPGTHEAATAFDDPFSDHGARFH